MEFYDYTCINKQRELLHLLLRWQQTNFSEHQRKQVEMITSKALVLVRDKLSAGFMVLYLER